MGMMRVAVGRRRTRAGRESDVRQAAQTTRGSLNYFQTTSCPLSFVGSEISSGGGGTGAVWVLSALEWRCACRRPENETRGESERKRRERERDETTKEMLSNIDGDGGPRRSPSRPARAHRGPRCTAP